MTDYIIYQLEWVCVAYNKMHKGPALKSFMRQVVIIEDHVVESFGFHKMCLKSQNLLLKTKKKSVL